MKYWLNRELRHYAARSSGGSSSAPGKQEVAAFQDAVQVAARAFGNNAFRKYSPGKGGYESTVSNAVFDTVMLTLDALLSDDGAASAATRRAHNKRRLLAHTDAIRSTLERLFTDDPEWAQLVSRPTSRAVIQQRIDCFRAALAEAVPEW